MLIENDNRDELFFKATTTYNQVVALAIYMKRHCESEKIIKQMPFLLNVKEAKNADFNDISKWLKNSWNTEKIMRTSNDILKNNENQFALQWSFPQAYYSIFSSILAYFKTVGYTESSHNAILKKFGKLCKEKNIQ